MNSEEEKYMLRCIQLAQNGLCNTEPDGGSGNSM